MASVPFSATFCFQAKATQKSSVLWPSMAFSIPSTKSALGSSKSGFFRNGFSLQSQVLPGFLVKSRSLGIFARAVTEKSLYDFTVKDIDEKDVPLSKFKGKVLLIVNVASRCGLTTANYSELSHLYEKYKTQGFEILAFPCNQFGGQEPGSNPEIKQFACTRFKAEFPIFNKVDVNGPNTAPVYQFLKSSAGGFLGDVIKWNFEKFLVDKNGKVVERYAPTTSPFQIEFSSLKDDGENHLVRILTEMSPWQEDGRCEKEQGMNEIVGGEVVSPPSELVVYSSDLSLDGVLVPLELLMVLSKRALNMFDFSVLRYITIIEPQAYVFSFERHQILLVDPFLLKSFISFVFLEFATTSLLLQTLFLYLHMSNEKSSEKHDHLPPSGEGDLGKGYCPLGTLIKSDEVAFTPSC
ncbi:hypothetical protein TIFTF001_009494 [Ficus carica]|uniref:Glutathione peroxidase n=1 Tax=Ficus carica TaxID=3494 RepID=A0AA87ZTW3_FICCA|nr:hypothetical protein TIFTF001_009494 [Ficus carica]